MRMWNLWNALADFVYLVGVAVGFVAIAGLIWFFLPGWIAFVFAILIACGLVLGVYEIKDMRRQPDN